MTTKRIGNNFDKKALFLDFVVMKKEKSIQNKINKKKGESLFYPK